MIARSSLFAAAVIALSLSATSHTPTGPLMQPRLAIALQVNDSAESPVDFIALRRDADAALRALVEKDTGALALQSDNEAS